MDEADFRVSNISGVLFVESYFCLCLEQDLIALSGALFPLSPQVQGIHLLEGSFPLLKRFWRVQGWG